MTRRNRITIARYLLGFAFLVFGLDGFFRFLPIPPARPAAERFIGAIIDTGYFFQMVKAIEILGGCLLLADRFIPFALLLLAPVLASIASIHLFLNPEGLPLAGVLALLQVYLARWHWPAFRPLFSRLDKPAGQP